MIIALLLEALDWIITNIVALLPDPNLHLSGNGYIQTVLTYVFSLNNYLPITDGFVPIMAASLTIGSIAFIYQIVKKIINWGRGAGG